MKIKELLAILDLPENQQKIYLAADGILGIAEDEIGAAYLTESLADVAFRLRNKCHDLFGWCAWDRACWEVYHKQYGSNVFESKHVPLETRERDCLNWMLFWADPIHWIIAALITKEIVADPTEKFDAHLTEEDVKTSIHNILATPKGTRAVLPNFSKKVKKVVLRSKMYGIAQDNGNGEFGFWKGLNPFLEAMLKIDGRNEKSVLFRFNEDGTNEIIYRWVCGEWMKVVGEYREDG